MLKTKTSTKKAPTMADLLAAQKKVFNALSSGQKVKGIVTSIDNKSLILDIDAKAEGIVAEKAYVEAREYIAKLKVGDEVTATVIFPEARDGSIILSLKDAVHDSVWKKIEEAIKSGVGVAVYARGVNSSGISVDVDGLSGFIPTSQLGKEFAKNPQALIGKYFKAKVIEADRNKNKLVLSEREISDASDIAIAKEALKNIKDGEVFDGIVTTVANFGCFVEIKVGKAKMEGLVHVSELSWGKVAHPQDVVAVGDKVKVASIGVRDGKLALSIKHAKKDPWEEYGKDIKKDDKVEGEIAKQTDFGVFVEIKPGLEGLIHITKIPPGKRFKSGEKVNCYVEEVDIKNRKISLGLVLTSIPVGYK